jgi:hypothetical protein
MAFQTKMARARFVVGPFSAAAMVERAGSLRDGIYSRIAQGINANDQPARALAPGYAKAKVRRGRNPVRDWRYQIVTLDHMNVLSANENRAVIGFSHPLAAMHAHFQNARERQFGVSPKDRDGIVTAVRVAAAKEHVVSVGRVV